MILYCIPRTQNYFRNIYSTKVRTSFHENWLPSMKWASGHVGDCRVLLRVVADVTKYMEMFNENYEIVYVKLRFQNNGLHYGQVYGINIFLFRSPVPRGKGGGGTMYPYPHSPRHDYVIRNMSAFLIWELDILKLEKIGPTFSHLRIHYPIQQ